jgi:hypothetical protein
VLCLIIVSSAFVPVLANCAVEKLRSKCCQVTGFIIIRSRIRGAYLNDNFVIAHAFMAEVFHRVLRVGGNMQKEFIIACAALALA